MPSGFSDATSAGPPSPASLGLPSPANVEMTPDVETRRTLLQPASEMYRFPARSTARPKIKDDIEPAIAGPPSPPHPVTDPPATVLRMPSVETLRTRAPPFSSTR